MKVPSAEDVDRHLNQYSRYARVVRGAARVAGLATRLAWTNQGWVEQFKHEEAVLGSLNLVRVPPLASIPVSRSLEEALSNRPIPESLRHAIAKADGTQVKWVEMELTGPISADTMAALISLKTELVKSGAVAIMAADRPKEVPRPEFSPPPVKAARARPRAAASKPAATTAARSARPAKAKKPAPKKAVAKKASKPLKTKKVARKPAAKSAKRVKRR